MHPLRTALVIAAGLGVLVLGLPWFHMRVLDQVAFIWGFQDKLPLFGAGMCFLAGLMAIAGTRAAAPSVVARLITVLLALLASGAAALALYALRRGSDTDDFMEKLARALMQPSYGLFLLLTSSAVLLLLALTPASVFGGKSNPSTTSGGAQS